MPLAAGAAAAIERPEPEDAPVDGTDNVLVQGFARVVRELASSAPVVPDGRPGTTERRPDAPEDCP
ncbi:hypothetical protein GCM10010207_69540 [Streptomyces atratus]|nr:hypothetical protein GCM10010207_69540 [Streptomyces atratus]